MADRKSDIIGNMPDKDGRISYKEDLADVSKKLGVISNDIKQLIQISSNTSRFGYEDARDSMKSKPSFQQVQDKWRSPEKEQKRSSFSTKSNKSSKRGEQVVDDTWDYIVGSLGIDKIKFKSTGSKLGKYLDDFQDEFIENLFDVGGFKSKINDSLSRYADELGVAVDDIPKVIANGIANSVKESKIGSSALSAFENIFNGIYSGFDQIGESIISGLKKNIDFSKFKEQADNQKDDTNSQDFTRRSSTEKSDKFSQHQGQENKEDLLQNNIINAQNEKRPDISNIFSNIFGDQDNYSDVRITNADDIGSFILAKDLHVHILNIAEIVDEINKSIFENKEEPKSSIESDDDISNAKDEPKSEENTSDRQDEFTEEYLIRILNSLNERKADFDDNKMSSKDKAQFIEDANFIQSNIAKGKADTFSDESKNMSKEILGNVFDSIANANKMGPTEDLSGIGEIIANGMGGLGDIFTTLLGPVAGGFATLVAVLGPVVVLLELLQPVLEALTALFGAFGRAANREEESRKKRQALAQQRLEADIKSMVEAPFNILKDAANSLYSTWNEAVKTINATQGYTKADLQDLMSTYAQRIRDEGLEKAVDVSQWTQNLSKVLDKGLTGKIGEEFALIATKLNAAVPTQDFFSYADTYASLIAQAQVSGMSQVDAIEHANKALEQMASNLVYAGREISGGITIGLQSGADLFADAVKIAQAGRQTDNETIDRLTGTLTSASAIIGAIAPDLSKSITDAITSAATGGNSQTIVALRSLSNQNASNTEFLKKFVDDPQSIFSAIFNNLSTMFNESEDAYMEKAEAYASLFGMSAEAFQRVDFNLLATAINNMNVNNSALEKNLELIKDGQTTTSTEQLKMQQINQYMIEEGLAYVIDNDVAQMIQQHMWDEQLAREMQETTYGIELVGKSFSLLDAIAGFVERLVNLLNPFYWAKKIANVIQSAQETAAWEGDIADMLDAVKVGTGNQLDKYQLTTRNQTFALIGENNKYNEALANAGYNVTSHVAATTKAYTDAFRGTRLNFTELADSINRNTRATLANSYSSERNTKSLYKWHMVTKSEARAAADALKKGASESAKAMTEAGAATKALLDAEAKRQKEIQDYVARFEDQFVNQESTVNKLATAGNTIVQTLFGWMFEQKVNIPEVAKQAASQTEKGSRQSFMEFYNKLSESKDFDAQNDLLWVQPDEKRDYTIYNDNTLRQFAKDSSKTFEDWEAKMFELAGWSSDKVADNVKADYKNRELIGKMADAFEDIAREEYGMNIDQYREYFEAERSNAEVDMQRMIEQEEKLAREGAIYFYDSASADLGRLIELFLENNSLLNTIATLVSGFKNLFAEYKIKWQSYYLGNTSSVVGYGDTVFDESGKKLLGDLENAEKSLTGFTSYENRLNSGLKKGESYYTKIQEVQNKEKNEKDDSVLALAEALTQNTVDLRDPQVQGNALLAEILKLVAALVNQNNTTTSNTILSDSISALATGTAANTVNAVTSVVGTITGVNVPT